MKPYALAGQSHWVQTLATALEESLHTRLAPGYQLRLGAFRRLPSFELVGTAVGRSIEITHLIRQGPHTGETDVVGGIYVTGGDTTWVRQTDGTTWRVFPYEHSNPDFPESMIQFILGLRHETDIAQAGKQEARPD